MSLEELMRRAARSPRVADGDQVRAALMASIGERIGEASALLSLAGQRVCRECGCTDEHGCVTSSGPCRWVADDLCSACQESASLPRRLRSEGEA